MTVELVLINFLQLLDVCDLTVHSVLDAASGKALDFDLDSYEEGFGSILGINLPGELVPKV